MRICGKVTKYTTDMHFVHRSTKNKIQYWRSIIRRCNFATN